MTSPAAASSLSDARELSELAAELLERATAAGADEAQVQAVRSTERKVALERNDLSLAASGEEVRLGLKIHKDGRQGAAQTNSPHPDDLARAVENALALAAFAPPDEHLVLPGPRPYAPTEKRWDPALVGISEGRLQELASALLAAMRADERVSVDSGAVEVEVGERWILNSHGIRVGDRWTRLDWNGCAQGLDGDEVTSFDFIGGVAYSLAGAPARIEQDGRVLGERVVDTFGAARAPSYRGRVLLSPRAVGDVILEPLEFHLSGLQVLYGKSSLPDERVGTPIASPLFSLADEPGDLELLGSTPFDSEGVPTTPRALVEEGVLAGHLENAYSARRRGRVSTGHAELGLHGARIAAGDAELDDLLWRPGPLLVVHRFSGNVDGSSGDFSGVAKGSHLVAGAGERRPVRETMIAGNLFELIHRIEAVSHRAEASDGAFRSPWLLVDGISVTGE